MELLPIPPKEKIVKKFAPFTLFGSVHPFASAMSSPSHPSRTSAYHPNLVWFSALTLFWTGFLIYMGGYTTSIGAGMAFPDWPLSDGSLDPTGWLRNPYMFAEHGHRLTAGVVSILTLILAVWAWRRDARRWLRWLIVAAFGLVLLQAVVGGLRVLMNSLEVNLVDTSAGMLFAMLHACLAQVFFCTVAVITAALSRPWIERRAGLAQPVSPGVRKLGLVCCALIFLQLIIGAIMRHKHAGLAIPTFPLTPAGGLFPHPWDFRAGINFAHRAGAAVLTLALPAYAITIWRSRTTSRGLGWGAAGLLALLAGQITLGAWVIWSARNPYITTVHVIVGACILATTVVLTFITYRHAFEPAGANAVRPEAGRA